jgi:hypothetical protein
MAQKRIKMTEEDRKANQPYDIDVIPVPAHPSKTTRVINKFVVMALMAIAVSLAIFMSWSFESTPLTVKNSPFPTRGVPPTPAANDVLILDIDYCKNTNKQGQVRASYVSETREIFMPISTEQYDKGCFREDIPIIIPADLPADTYSLRFVATYNLNPLKQRVQVEFSSQEFVISNTNGRSAQE